MPSAEQPSVTPEQLDGFCREHLGAAVRQVVLTAGYSSRVVGVELSDGPRVVVKWRRWRARLLACSAVHRQMWRRTSRAPSRSGRRADSASWPSRSKRTCPEGRPLDRGEGVPARLAGVLADFVRAAPSPDAVDGDLAPDMGFLRWAHAGDGLWPRATDIDADLNAAREPAWLDDAAQAARARLAGTTSPAFVGHGDWWSDDVRLDGARLLSVDDWNSVVALPEAALVGAAAALHADGCSTVDETEQFLTAYALARGRPWAPDDRKVA